MSTYSTNLALTLIGNGEQAGNWGQTTNTNIGVLLEQAISGYATQAITDAAVDTTLAMTQGATATARNMYIELTGSLSATRNLVVPNNKKLYFIWNNTTGGFPVTVKVSGGSGVSVPSTFRTIVVCNGVDIYPATTSAATGVTQVGGTGTASGISLSGTVTSTGNLTLSGTVNVSSPVGTLPIVNGGTGASSLSGIAAAVGAALFPVGSIYSSTSGTNPASTLGFGSWSQFGAGRVMIGAGGAYSPGSTGGTADADVVQHTHSAVVNDSGHSHTTVAFLSNLSGQTFGTVTAGASGPVTTSAATNLVGTGISVGITSTGNSGVNANLPPYIVVYMWQRVG